MAVSFLAASEADELVSYLSTVKSMLPREQEAWTWGLRRFKDTSDFKITVRRDDAGRIDSAALGYSVDAALELKKPVLPYWIIGMVRMPTESNSVSSRQDELIGPMLYHFERSGRLTFFMGRLTLPALTLQNSEEWLARSQPKIGVWRYDARLEVLLEHPRELERLPLMYKLAAHANWTPGRRKMAIIRHDLRYSER
jgi:hypothetical protein